MTTSKTEFRYFTIPEWEKEQQYLQERHREGWKFTGVRFLGIYHFERCEPEEVVYQLDYNPSSGNERESYIQMFRDCGWEYLQDFVGYSYFRKPVSQMRGEEEIFCDDASRLDMMRQVWKGRMIPLLILMLVVFLPNLWLNRQLDTPEDWFCIGIFGVLLVLYLVVFGQFGYQFWKYASRMKK